MKWTLIALIIILVAGFALFATMNTTERMTESESPSDMPASATVVYDVAIDPVEHASAVLTWANTTLYIDPVGGADAYSNKNAPNIIALTDIHPDHLNVDTLNAITATNTTIVAPQAVYDELPEALQQQTTVISNGENTTVGELSIEAMPMYNLPESEDAWHVKGRGNGYVIEQKGVRAYIAGDTAGIPEMRALTNIDIAFVPMNLPYTMDIEEAADAVIDFAPRTVIPYHYRGQDGLSDVQKFKTLVEAANNNTTVLLLNWYN